MDIVELIKKEVISDCEKYKEKSKDKYDFWNNHIKYALEEGERLAISRFADKEIVTLGILLHDIALIREVGDKEEHHIEGAKIALDMLEKYGYDPSRATRVYGCVYNHRKGINSHNVEERCVSDADILSHFRNIPMLFNKAFKIENLNIPEARERVKFLLEEDYNDLTEETKQEYKDTYIILFKLLFDEEPKFKDDEDEPIPFIWY